MTLQNEYKALTNVNLPFIGDEGNGKTFSAGATIPVSDIEAYVERANAAVDDLRHKDPDASPPVTVESEVERLMEWGSISDDLNAELHPDHRPVDPTAPTIPGMVIAAQQLVASLEERGQDVPEEIRTLAESHIHVVTTDAGRADDRVAGS